MKTIATFTALLLTAVSAAPVEQRQAAELDITNFSANTLPYGDGAFLSYNIAIPGGLKTSCGYSDQTSISDLPSIYMTPCDDPAVEWQFHQDPAGPGAEGRYRIVIKYNDGTGRWFSGWHEWAPTDFPEESYGSTVETFYRGGKDFVITNLS